MEIKAAGLRLRFKPSRQENARRTNAMSPTDLRLAVDAHREAIDVLSGYCAVFPVIPRHIIANHVADEIAHRIRSGIRSRRRLVRYGIEAVLRDRS